MKKIILYVVLALIVVAIGYEGCNKYMGPSDKAFKNTVDSLHKENDSLKVEIVKDNKQIDSMQVVETDLLYQVDNQKAKVFTVVQIPAEFPGGLPAWQKYLERNLNRDLPVENGAPPGKYTVYVTFIVDKSGGMSDVAAENDPGYGTKDEAIRVIKKGPNWKPAVQNGRNVNYRHIQNIIFVVAESND